MGLPNCWDTLRNCVSRSRRAGQKKQLESHEEAIEKGGVTVASFSDFDDDDSGGSYASVSVQSGDSDDNEEVDVLKQALKERDSRGKVKKKKKKKRKKKEGSDEEDIDALMDSIPTDEDEEDRVFDPMFDDIDDMDGRRPLPSKYTPNAWAGASLFLLVLTAHSFPFALPLVCMVQGDDTL